MKMKRLLSAFLVVAMVAVMAAGCGGKGATSSGSGAGGGAAADGDVITVTMQLTFPETNAANMHEVLNKIEEESGGRVKFELYYSFSMIGNTDIVDALQDGTLDIAGLMPAENASVLPLNGRVCGFPFLGIKDYESANRIYMHMLYNNDDMMAEYENNDLVFWSGYMCPGYQLYSVKEGITDTTPNVLGGMTVITENPEMQTFIQQHNGAAMPAAPPDYYSNLNNGVSDGLVQHINCVNAFGCTELVKTALYFGDGGFYFYPLVYCMNKDFYASLPDDIRVIFEKYANDIMRGSFDFDKDQMDGNFKAMEDAGATIIKLSDAEISKWQDEFAGIAETALDEISADAPAARSCYDQLVKTIADYDPATFEIGTNNFGYEVEW